MNVEIGSICIGIECQDRELTQKMLNNYRPFLVSREPDFRIDLILRNSLSASEVKQRLSTSKSRIEGDRYFTDPSLIDMAVDWKQAFLRVETERELFNPEVDYKLMNQLMIGIYAGVFSKIKNSPPDAYLFHGCGIASREQCFLFTGPSGIGKTTVAKLAGGRTILNDEAVLISKGVDGIYVSGTPLDGGQPEKHNTSVRLTSIFFLKQDKQVAVRELGKVDAYIRLVSQFFSTASLFEQSENECLWKRTEISSKIANELPSYELSFCLNSSFWKAVESN